MNDKTVTRTIKRYGNGAMIPVHKADMDALGLDVGSKVQVTLKKVEDAYDATASSAQKMRHRFAHTLDLLGK